MIHPLGDAQFQKIRAALGKDGLFGSVDCLLAVHSMPAIYFSTGVSSCLQCVPCLTDKVLALTWSGVPVSYTGGV